MRVSIGGSKGPITKEFMIDYLKANDDCILDAWDAAENAQPCDHIHRELTLIIYELEETGELDTVEMFGSRGIRGGVVSLPDLFHHRHGQRYYNLIIYQIEQYTQDSYKQYLNSFETVLKDQFQGCNCLECTPRKY